MGLREGIEGRKMLNSFGPCITRPFLLMLRDANLQKWENNLPHM
jgi:hypothetical protein